MEKGVYVAHSMMPSLVTASFASSFLRGDAVRMRWACGHVRVARSWYPEISTSFRTSISCHGFHMVLHNLYGSSTYPITITMPPNAGYPSGRRTLST